MLVGFRKPLFPNHEVPFLFSFSNSSATTVIVHTLVHAAMIVPTSAIKLASEDTAGQVQHERQNIS